MKVLHVIPSIGPLRGGPSVVVRQLAAGLVKSGVETHVATTNDNADSLLDVPLGVPVGDGGVTYWFFARQTKFYGVSLPLASWLAEHVAEFDVVHIHALFSFASLPAAFWAHRRRVPYIVRPLGTLNEWGMANRRPWLKRASFAVLESQVAKHAALMHYTSEDERREASQAGVTTASVVIPNAVGDIDAQPVERGAFRWTHGLSFQRKMLLFLSRLDEKKGIDILLRAFADVRATLPDSLLVIAGNGPSDYVTTLKAEAQSLGVQHDVVWAGFLAGEEKRAALADADVFVLPSHSENFGVAVAEAMAAGVPVVVSDKTAIHHDVTAAGAGVVVSCEPRRVADAVVALLSEPERAAAMGRAGAAFARQRYSIDAVTQRVIEAYHQAVVGTSFRSGRAELGTAEGHA